MTIVEKISKTINDGVNFPMYYGNRYDINTIMETATLPCAFCFLLDNNTITQENGILRERANLIMFFANLKQSEDQVANEQVIDTMKKTACKWILHLYKQDAVVIKGNTIQGQRFDMFDSQLIGYGIQLTLEEVEGISSCDL